MAGPDPRIHVLILAGGIGSRFWPASTPSLPKQLLPLTGGRPLVAETVERALSLVPPERLRILTGRHLVDPIRRALPSSVRDSFLVEPRARGTGPVLAWAAWLLARDDPDAVLLSLHSDHRIEPEDEFLRTLRSAGRIARDQDALVTVSVEPDRPETGYGYIRPGEALGSRAGGTAAFRVAQFVEKPDARSAAAYLAEGYLWNTGIFAWAASRFLEEVRIHAPEIARHFPLLEEGDADGYFRSVSPVSVDEAVLERSGRVASVRATFEWDDVGSWEALSRTRPADERGNVSIGELHAVDSTGTIAYTTGEPIVLFGTQNLVVVRTDRVTFVASRERAGELKELLRRLPDHLKELEPGE